MIWELAGGLATTRNEAYYNCIPRDCAGIKYSSIYGNPKGYFLRADVGPFAYGNWAFDAWNAAPWHY